MTSEDFKDNREAHVRELQLSYIMRPRKLRGSLETEARTFMTRSDHFSGRKLVNIYEETLILVQLSGIDAVYLQNVCLVERSRHTETSSSPISTLSQCSR